MKRAIQVFFLILVVCLSTSCAMAPLSNHYTGRSLGKGNMRLNIGATGNVRVLTAQLQYGINENLDLIAQYETVNFGAILKYSFLNNQEGLAAAVMAAYGSSGDGTYYYGGATASIKLGMFEPYVAGRYNSVQYKTSSVDLGFLGDTPIAAGSYNYMYYTAGANLHFLDWMGLSVEAGFLGTDWPGSGTAAILSAALMFTL
jgi:hypothetical protein